MKKKHLNYCLKTKKEQLEYNSTDDICYLEMQNYTSLNIMNLLSKRQMKTKTCFSLFFFFSSFNWGQFWMNNKNLDLAFLRCEESCRSLGRLLVDNTLLDLHHFSDSTQPYPRIAKNVKPTITIKSVGKVAFFTSSFPSSPRPWPNVDQNVNVCARNCSVISLHWIGGTGDI